MRICLLQCVQCWDPGRVVLVAERVVEWLCRGRGAIVVESGGGSSAGLCERVVGWPGVVYWVVLSANVLCCARAPRRVCVCRGPEVSGGQR